MSDDPTPLDLVALDAPAPSRLKRLRLPIGLGLVVAIVGGLVASVIYTDKMRGLYCKYIGVLCVKTVVAKAIIVPPAGCPDFKIKGAFRTRGADDPVWSVAGDVRGHVALTQGTTTISGTSSVACFGGEFLASFTLPNELVYQCLGTLDGKVYEGVCNRSVAGAGTISGTFSN